MSRHVAAEISRCIGAISSAAQRIHGSVVKGFLLLIGIELAVSRVVEGITVAVGSGATGQSGVLSRSAT